MVTEMELYRYNRFSLEEVPGPSLDRYSHDSAYRAETSACEAGLGFTVYSYSEILDQAGPNQDPIKHCAQITGTKYEEQLKSLFVSDAPLDGKHRPYAAIAVTKYPDRIDFKKLADAISSSWHNAKVGPLRSNVSGIESLNIIPGYLGVNPRCPFVPWYFTPSNCENFEPYSDDMYTTYVIDQSIRELPKFAMLAGYRKADALVVVDGQDKALGNRLDIFFNRYLFNSPHTIAGIIKAET